MTIESLSFRKYGQMPISLALLHGGPGAIGDMAPVAARISSFCGVIEPFQKEKSIGDELLHLKDLLEKETKTPVVLVGHSFGAWVATLFAAQFPSLVKKLILIGCPPFEERYVPLIMKKRHDRMSLEEIKELEEMKSQLSSPEASQNTALFARFGKLFRKIDSFDPIEDENEEVVGDPALYSKIWKEAQELRRSGGLVQSLQKVICPITVLHGEMDPHPYEGVFDPITRFHHDFKGILLKECGHTPWIEKRAKESFFELLRNEIQ